MHNPVNELYKEHGIITAAVELAQKAGELAETAPNRYDETMRQLIAFFRQYADSYHHHKEEEILFPEIMRKNELLADGVVKEMLENHEDFRGMLASIEAFIEKKDYSHARQQMNLYAEALLDHIAVENDELFVTAESLFTEAELEQMYFRFADSDSEKGADLKLEFEQLVARLEAGLGEAS